MNAHPAIQILLVDDQEIVHETLGEYLKDAGHRVTSAYNGRDALAASEKTEFDLALVDFRMPGIDGLTLLQKLQDARPELSVVIITGHSSVETVIQALRLGAADFLTKPVELRELDYVIEKTARLRRLRQDGRRLLDTIEGIQLNADRRERNRTMIGVSRATETVREQIRQAVEARCDTILITGETGTGKEVVAREIHFHSGRAQTPFIAVSCPTLPDTLVEAELFGHVKGAFTGATHNRAGYFELAHGGTLFLDEIADLSPEAQAALLRVLETRTLRRVGGTREISVNIRLIAASNAPLEERVATGRLRHDLFYRLNVFSIHLLPLRERRDDILPLARHFLETYAAFRGVSLTGFSPEAEALLRAYDYPGNARELRNLVERAAILCRSGHIRPGHLNLPAAPAKTPPPGTSAAQNLENPERTLILQALQETHWNRRLAAERLDMPYSTLRYKIKKYGLS